jgi:hypothetical protein
MENLQDLLNVVANSEFVKSQQIGVLSKRKIVYVFKNGVLIDTMNSIAEFEKKYGKNQSTPLREGYETNKGFYYSFENEYNPKRKMVWSYNPRILVYYEGKMIGIFDTDREIEKTFNLNRRDIFACLTNRKNQKSTKGYSFEYEDITGTIR